MLGMVWYQGVWYGLVSGHCTDHLQGGMMAVMGSQGMRATAYPHRTHLTVVGNNDFCGGNGKDMYIVKM